MEHGWIGGMHMAWWVFWVLMIILFLAFMEAKPKNRNQQKNEEPLEILKRRYAAGEITTEEYEERKAHLEEET